MLPCLSALFIWVIWVLFSTYYNHLHRQKYYELIAYLRHHEPEVATRIELKPILGFLYPRGGFRPSIKYARDHEPLDDPVAEELLADYARLSERGKWLILIGGVLGVLVLIVVCWQADKWFSPI